jgi:ribosomal protein S18 acetylase RimI-like enzyme
LGGSVGHEREDLEVERVKKWVVLSCTPNSVYDFFLPIAVRLWRKRIGYEPVIVLVGTDEEWSSGHAAVALASTKGRIECFRPIPEVPDAAVAMALRQHVSALEFAEDDLIMIGDVDLFPVDREFYHRYDPARNPVGIYYAETYGDAYWPAYGVSMPVRNWREVMGVAVGDFRGSVQRAFSDENVKAVGLAEKIGTWDTRFWTFDERHASFRIKNSRFAKDVATFPSVNGKKVPHRVKLPSQPYSQDYVDFHCSRPGWTEENWPDLRHMLAQIMPEDLRWLDQYADAYRRSIGVGLKVQSDNLQATTRPWESEPFEVNVGLLALEGPAPRTLSVAEANRDLDVVFVKIPGWHEPKGVVALDYTYEMELCDRPPASDRCAVVELQEPRQAHVAIACNAFPDSRFHRDPKLALKAGAFYEKWLRGDGKLYALEALQDDAFLFVSVDPDGAGRISLVAVFDKSRGISYGGSLICGVMHLRSELVTWRVRVNSRNVRAIRFYEKLGFRMKSVQTAYHVWTKD